MKKPKEWIVAAVLSPVLLGLWMLPHLWYTSEAQLEGAPLLERTEIEGWTFEAMPISEAAERSLVADETVNGEFRNAKGEAIRVFSAQRFSDNPNEIGLFVHTPDRCWVEGGWKMEATNPDVQEIQVHGLALRWERRLFHFGGKNELVYFCGLLDGQPLPYRLDHNVSIAARAGSESDSRNGLISRVGDTHFWQRVWNSVTSRRSLSGPKQFFRISTPVGAENLEAADARLKSFLLLWLTPANRRELSSRPG